jgi:CMP-N,N'-diacetyllegionaminic acid synthase
MEILALITARGGSRTIPHKNIMSFHGKPLIAWSIEAALNSESVSRVVTSTDDLEIADIAKKFGSEVPFIRPEEYAQDDTTDYPVFKHALDWLSINESYHPDIIIHLRPTTPLRPLALIDKGVNLMLTRKNADSLRCVCEPHNNPFKMWSIDNEGFMHPLCDSGIFEQYNQPRQLLPDVYWQVGTLDITRSKTILEKKSMSGNNILSLVIDKKFAVDIDDIASLNHADFVINKYGMFPE